MSSILAPCIHILSTSMLVSSCSNSACENSTEALVSKFCPDCGNPTVRNDNTNVSMMGNVSFSHYMDHSPEFADVISSQGIDDTVYSVGYGKSFWCLLDYAPELFDLYRERGVHQKNIVEVDPEFNSVLEKFKNEPDVKCICSALDAVKPKPIQYEIVYGMINLK